MSARTNAVGVVGKRTGDVVVDDAVAGIGCRRPDVKRRRSERAGRRQGSENGILQPDGVCRHVVVQNDIDIRSAECGVKQKIVAATKPDQRVGAGGAVEDIGARIAADRVGESVAGQVDRSRTVAVIG